MKIYKRINFLSFNFKLLKFKCKYLVTLFLDKIVQKLDNNKDNIRKQRKIKTKLLLPISLRAQVN